MSNRYIDLDYYTPDTYIQAGLEIDWHNRIIYVPRTYMTLVQSTPVEIRELNSDVFRLELKSLEDEPVGMAYPDTHKHVPSVSVGGVELAKIIEIINGYTITFEDGQYAVNITRSNNNIGDVINVNQVSVRSANSAGLVQTTEIEYSSFQGGVWVNQASTVQGTAYPAGTARQPVSNLSDAMLIAWYRGLTTIYSMGDMIIDSGGDYRSMTFIGESKNKTDFFISASSNVTKCEFYEANVSGTLDGDCVLKDCVISDLSYISGYVENCVLDTGIITLGGSTTAHFLDCVSGLPGIDPPIIDCGGDGPSLVIRNYNGSLKITNKTGLAKISIDLNSGEVILDSTVTNGAIVVRGVGSVIDNSNGAAVETRNLVRGETIKLIEQILRNKTTTDPVSGIMTVYDDLGQPLLTTDVFEDLAGTQKYRGRGADRRDRLT